MSLGEFLTDKKVIIVAVVLIMVFVLSGGVLALQRLAYKVSNGGAEPAKDHFMVSCNVILENPMFRDVQVQGQPSCYYSPLVDSFDCQAEGLEPLSFLPFSKDEGKVEMRVDNRLLQQAGYQLGEQDIKLVEFNKVCAQATSKEIQFTVLNNKNSVIDSKIIAIT